MLDLRFIAIIGPCDGDDVEARWAVKQAVAFEECQGKTRELGLFALIDGVGGMAGVGRPAGLYFDENDGLAVKGHEIQLAQFIARAAGQRLVAELLEESFGFGLASLSE